MTTTPPYRMKEQSTGNKQKELDKELLPPSTLSNNNNIIQDPNYITQQLDEHPEEDPIYQCNSQSPAWYRDGETYTFLLI